MKQQMTCFRAPGFGLFLKIGIQSSHKYLTSLCISALSFFIVFSILLLLVTTLKLSKLSDTFSHLASCPKMVHFANMVYFCHCNMHQSATLGYIGYPLQLRVQSLLHLYKSATQIQDRSLWNKTLCRKDIKITSVAATE